MLAQAATGITVLSVDWTTQLAELANRLSAAGNPVALQGNLDPVLLNTTPAIVERETSRLLESMRGNSRPYFQSRTRDTAAGEDRMRGVARSKRSTNWK